MNSFKAKPFKPSKPVSFKRWADLAKQARKNFVVRYEYSDKLFQNLANRCRTCGGQKNHFHCPRFKVK